MDACVYLIDGTHPCYGSYVVSDGDECGSGQVFLTDAVALLFAHHVTKTVKINNHIKHNMFIKSVILHIRHYSGLMNS